MHRLKTWQLFAVCVAIWSTTWHAITYQLGPTAPEVAVALRFGLAGALVLLACAWRRLPLRLALADHARLAWQGTFLYGVSYLCVYHAERWVASGLVAVGYSASPLIVGLGARLAFGAALSWRFMLGAALGLGGVALIFAPELAAAESNDATLRGAAFTVAAVVLSSVGSLSASRNHVRGIGLWPGMGLGMLYGGISCALTGLLLGSSMVVPTALSWWLSLAYLSLAGSVLAFACFLSLQNRLGPGRAGTVGVMTPILALGVSLTLEGFRPTWPTFVGALLAVLGNWCILRPSTPPKIADPSTVPRASHPRPPSPRKPPS